MRHRLLKSLRIAVTSVSLLACGLLIVLWVKSYNHPEYMLGQLLGLPPLEVRNQDGVVLIALSRIPADDVWAVAQIVGEKAVLKPWHFIADQRTYIAGSFPHWFLVTIFAAIAALPWIKWRFSLRTLLIVLTLFAVFFGAIAMSMRSS